MRGLPIDKQVLSDMKKTEVVRSGLPLALRIVISAVLVAVLAVSASFFGIEVYNRPWAWKNALWIVAVGWAVTFVAQMLFNTPQRRLFVRMLKGLITIGKWDAESWLMQAFLWFSVCTYGMAVVLFVTLLSSPVSLIGFAVRG